MASARETAGSRLLVIPLFSAIITVSLFASAALMRGFLSQIFVLFMAIGSGIVAIG